MQIVIDIDEKDYNDIMFDVETSPRLLNRYEWLIAHGIPVREADGERMPEEHKEIIANLIMNDYDIRPSQARLITKKCVAVIEQIVVESEEVQK